MENIPTTADDRESPRGPGLSRPHGALDERDGTGLTHAECRNVQRRRFYGRKPLTDGDLSKTACMRGGPADVAFWQHRPCGDVD